MDGTRLVAAEVVETFDAPTVETIVAETKFVDPLIGTYPAALGGNISAVGTAPISRMLSSTLPMSTTYATQAPLLSSVRQPLLSSASLAAPLLSAVPLTNTRVGSTTIAGAQVKNLASTMAYGSTTAPIASQSPRTTYGSTTTTAP